MYFILKILSSDFAGLGGYDWYYIGNRRKNYEMDDRVGHSRFGILLQKIIRGI